MLSWISAAIIPTHSGERKNCKGKLSHARDNNNNNKCFSEYTGIIGEMFKDYFREHEEKRLTDKSYCCAKVEQVIFLPSSSAEVKMTAPVAPGVPRSLFCSISYLLCEGRALFPLASENCNLPHTASS